MASARSCSQGAQPCAPTTNATYKQTPKPNGPTGPTARGATVKAAKCDAHDKGPA